DASLLARPFDAANGRLTGEAVPVVPHLFYFATSGYAAFTVGRGGAVAFQSHSYVSHLDWFDRSGKKLGVLGPPGNYLDVTFSPDARRVFFTRARPATGAFGIGSIDPETSAESPVSPGPDTEVWPVLLPDGKTLIYAASKGRSPQLVRQDLATGRVEQMLPFGPFQTAENVSPDGKWLLFRQRGEQGIFDLWLLSLSGNGAPTPFVQSPFNKGSARFSPDGRYVAYLSAEGGSSAIYVTPFPGPGERMRILPRQAEALRWGRTGELLFVSQDARLVSVPIRTDPSLHVGSPVDLFALPEGRAWQSFDVTPDGKRILGVVPEVEPSTLPLDVIVNWAPAAAR
ncbi:MAG TPA: hypothetical protein VKG23_10640, partial [Thermoanaerobaculia bacterium]|nr:hypothetical protein [Thermoanaerobaculia bacterium]